MELLHPGVYLQEVSSGVRPIEGVSTSTAAFIGKAEMGPVGTPVPITQSQEFLDTFGGFLDDGWLAHSVVQFFFNGGVRCYVVRVTGAGARPAEIALRDRKSPQPARTLTVSAASPGAWGNRLDLVVRDGSIDPDNEFAIEVYRDRSMESPPQPAELLETHDNLSMNREAVNFVERAIVASSRRITVRVDSANLGTAGSGSSRSGRLPLGNGAGEFRLTQATGATRTDGAAGPPPTRGRLRSGDNPALNAPADRRRFLVDLDGDGPQAVTVAPELTTGPASASAIQEAVRALIPNNVARLAAYSGFTCTYQTPPAPAAPFLELTSGSAGTVSSVVVSDLEVANPGAALLRLGVGRGGAEAPGTAAGGGNPATAGTSRSGPSPATTLPEGSRQITVNLDGDGRRDITIAAAPDGPATAAAIQAAVRALAANNNANQPAYANFTCTFETPAPPAAPFYRLTSGTTGVTSTVVVTDTRSADPGIALGPGTRRFVVEVNRDGPHIVSLTGPLANGAAIAAAIQTAVRAVSPKRAANAAAFAAFTCSYQTGNDARNPSLVLTSGAPGAGSAVRVSNFDNPLENVAGLLRLGITNGGAEISGAAVLRPASSQSPTEDHLGDASVVGNVDSAVAGDDGLPPGDLEHKNGLNALDTVRDVNLVAIPGISSPDVVATGVAYCTRRMDAFYIADAGWTDDTVDEARAFINSLTTKTSYGALYFPWLRMADPSGRSSQPILVPPSGFIAGLYARIDGRRGVWKAPAGTEAGVSGISGLAAQITDAQQDFLNPIGVNVIRSFPASGVVVWGARTLATRSDPEYRYVPVRRMAIFLEQSIHSGIQFAVFEPNDEPLWASLRLNIRAFMTLLFRQGAFQGASPDEAFFVRCDATTTTQADIDSGIVNILVGFAPLKPAEFVVLRLTQKAGQAAA